MSQRRNDEHVTVIGNDDHVTWDVIKELDEKRVPCYGPLRSIVNGSVSENGIVLMVITNGKESLDTLVEIGFLFLDCLRTGADLICVIEDYQDKSSLASRLRELVKANAKKNRINVFNDINSAISHVINLYD